MWPVCTHWRISLGCVFSLCLCSAIGSLHWYSSLAASFGVLSGVCRSHVSSSSVRIGQELLVVEHILGRALAHSHDISTFFFFFSSFLSVFGSLFGNLLYKRNLEAILESLRVLWGRRVWGFYVFIITIYFFRLKSIIFLFYFFLLPIFLLRISALTRTARVPYGGTISSCLSVLWTHRYHILPVLLLGENTSVICYVIEQFFTTVFYLFLIV